MNPRDLLIELVADPQRPVYSVPGTVTAVDEQAMTCDVSLASGEADVYGVRISAVPDSSGLRMVPSVGAACIITWMSRTTAFLSMVSDLDHLQCEVGNTTLYIDPEGVQLSRGAENLRSLLEDLCAEVRDLAQAVATMTVTCSAPGSPSSPPVNVAAFTTASTSIQTILNRVSTLLQ